MRAFGYLASVIDGQRGHLFPWAPVFLGVGVAIYFTIRFEPSAQHWWALGAAGAVLAAALIRLGQRLPLLIALALVLAGFGVAALRTHLVAAPVLEFRYYGPVQGRIVNIDRSASDKPRITLDRVVLSRVDPARTPERVRVSLHGQQGFVALEPGLTVILTAHLGAPEGPVEPGGYDFQRQAWFAGLGAVGYTRTPALAWAPAEDGKAGLFVHRARMAISAHVRGVLSGRTGAFAAAITTGDRSGMDEPTLEALRLSNLAHLLAISGMHMGMLTGFLYAAIRFGLALWPHAALNWPIHKIGAVVALAAGAVYLALSGGSVATERAYTMVAVMFCAILADRRALTLRAVALAALIILTFRPEALMGPGFQMSFAATTALIAVFASLRRTRIWSWPAVARWTFALVLSSLVAGMATAPFAAAHFNRVPHFGLFANILSVPLMGTLVMPAAVLAAVLTPLRLDWIGLYLMKPGIDWILGVADRIAGIDGTASTVVAPPPAVLPVLALGALWVMLWQGRLRWAGTVPVALALALWTQAERPALLISADGGLVGLMTEGGRALSKPRGQGFAAQSWLENDGDAADQPGAAARPGFEGEPGSLRFALAGAEIRHLWGRGASDRAVAECAAADLVILSGEAEGQGGCTLIDRKRLATTGPLAIWAEADGLRIVSARARVGARPWTGSE